MRCMGRFPQQQFKHKMPARFASTSLCSINFIVPSIA